MGQPEESVVQVAKVLLPQRRREQQAVLGAHIFAEHNAFGFGPYGEGFVRIALVENEQRLHQAARNIAKIL